jgi:N-acetylmuramoyl-L-alanine amidase
MSGMGHWVEPAPIRGDEGLGPGDEGDEIATAQDFLAQYGYQIRTTGCFNEETNFVVTAFQRHFRPQKVDGRLDLSTRQTLLNLIETMPQNSMS